MAINAMATCLLSRAMMRGRSQEGTGHTLGPLSRILKRRCPVGLGGFCLPKRAPACEVPSQQGKWHFHFWPELMAASGLPGDCQLCPGTNTTPFPPTAREEGTENARGGVKGAAKQGSSRDKAHIVPGPHGVPISPFSPASQDLASASSSAMLTQAGCGREAIGEVRPVEGARASLKPRGKQ